MRQFLVRRFLLSIVVLFGVSIMVYGLVRAMPSDYATNIAAGNRQITAEMVENWRRLYGLDVSVPEGYIRWISAVLQGDLGESFIFKAPVASIIGQKMWVSFGMAFTAFILELLIAIPLGVFSATRQYSKLDIGVTVFAFIGISLPTFFFSAVVQRIFAIELRWLPLSGMITARADYTGFAHFLDIAKHMVLPIMVFVVTGVGSLMRYTRTNMLEVLNADYIRTARAKGLSEHTVVYKHAFRNTMIPIVTIVGNALPGLFSGAIITEAIFSIDGIGNTAYNALKTGDIPFIMAFYMFLAILTLIGTMLSDVLYAVVDPRVRLG